MSILANIFTGLVALLHIYFLLLEMFLWDKPMGLRAFSQTRAQARATKIMAANQGLYNGFLAAGLIWGLLLGSEGRDIQLFFLACVLIAGVYGGISAHRKIIFVQALPAAIAILLVIFS
ncbi:MAG: DUF1304 domain-containing protein [Cellvibrionaceae bacterium]|nr:DUF1304 domain-containing protein [Cellvibrionaceae bacterium]